MENVFDFRRIGLAGKKPVFAAVTALAASAVLIVIGLFAAPGRVSAAPAAAISENLVSGVAADRFSWMLFVHAVGPSGSTKNPLAFESWPEQCDLQPQLCGLTGAAAASALKAAAKGGDKPKLRRAHASALGKRLMKASALAISPSKIGCSSMNTAGFPPSAPATNVAANAVFCEEVFMNQAEASFIAKNKLTTIKGQQTYGNVTFPWDALEIKVDWAPQSAFVKPFSCPSTTVYTEMIQFQGDSKPVCYAMVGMHISSKVLPNWLWATFEPNDALTNPNRCNDNLYNLCADSWGTTSSSAYGPGQTPPQSAALADIMKAAKLPAVFNNYYLTAAQTEHVVNGQPTQLGNSFVEFNAGVEPHQASCITCHNYAYAGTVNVGFPLTGWPSIGYACNTPGATASCVPSYPGAKTWTSEDFSWLLGIMP